MRRPSFARFQLEELESRVVPSTYYVAPGGSNQNAGADLTPWATLQYAADQVRAGDTVVVRAGNYAGFDLRADGTAAQQIQFLADAGVVINARNSRTPDGINLEGADHVVVAGFEVTGVERAGIRSVLNSHVTIRDNYAHHNGRWGIFTGFSDDVVIENNVTTYSALEHGIYVSNSGDRPVIRGNTTAYNRAAGIHMNGDACQGGDGVISGAVVEGNVIYENGKGGGSGINADGVQDSLFQNNLLHDNHASGISLFRIDGGDTSTGNLVANNTILVASGGRWAINIRDGSTGNTVVNNILYNYGSYRGSISVWADSLAGLKSDYNVVMERFTTDDGDSRLTLSQWQAATGQDSHSLVATPSQLFVNVTTHDYHLKVGSPALDRGTSSGAPSRDLEGNARPSGPGWDIGAFETQTAPANRAPKAVDDAATVEQDGRVALAVLANDSDPDSDPLRVTLLTGPASGSAVVGADGVVTYTPWGGFSGTDSLVYKVDDGRGGSDSATVFITVAGKPENTVGLEADPWNPGKQALVVRGTGSADTIIFSPVWNAPSVAVKMNGVARGTYSVASFTRIIAYGGAGDDSISVENSLRVSAELRGGAGNDVLLGGGGDDLLFGGDGDDRLEGRYGRNLYVGGAGADVLTSTWGGGQFSDGSDLLVGGTLSYENDPQAVSRLFQEWTSSRSYAERTSRLAAGLDGLPRLDGATAPDDGFADVFTGGGGSLDWFFASLPRDVLKDRAANERLG